MEKELIRSDIKLTIGMLVSNHIQYIRNAMEALKPLLEAIPSELVVVDTKGAETDGSIEVVREYTDKIYPFVWCNDFSAARNVCMQHARGEWFLYADDDEWFDDVQEFIDFFKSGECEKYNSGFYYTRDYGSDGTYSTGIAGRMIRRREDTCFVGKVHETFNEVYRPNKQFSCFTHHYGYAFRDLEEAKRHQERNVTILKSELIEVGGTPRLCAQMVQELIYLEHSADAAFRFAMDALSKQRETSWLRDSCAQWIMVATVRYFNRKKDYAGAKKQLAYLEQNFELTEIAQLALNGTMANMALTAENAEDMLKYAERYIALWNWKQKHEEEAMLQSNLDMPKYSEAAYYQRIVQIKEFAEGRLKQKDENSIYNFGQFSFATRKEEGTSKLPKLIKSNVKLTIGMLVSNHVQFIRNTMESLQPLLKAVSSELVVIDTMGEKTDGSIDIVREYTDKIYPFVWCNDFSAARNFCLDHAKGEWFLYLDDDEWFDDVQEFIDFFKGGECENYYSGYYYTRDYLPDGKYSMGIAGRMIRRTETTRFVGKVHETFNEVFAPNKQFSCFTHHYGYAYENEEAKAAKQKRNLDILKEEIRESGFTPQNAAQMVQELFQRKETIEEGYQYCMDSILNAEKQGKLMDSCSQWLLTASVRRFAEEDNRRLIEQAECIRSVYPLTQTGELVVAASVVFAAAAEKDYETVKEYCDIYLKNYDWRNEHEEEALSQTNMDFPRFYNDEYYYNIVHIAAITANHAGDFEQANLYWKRMPWGTEGFDGSRYAYDMQKTMQGLKELQERQKKNVKLKELSNLLDSLQEAGTYLAGLLKNGTQAETQELLAGMQEAAITVGTGLDEILGEGSEEVSLLEKYCELVWQCSNAETKKQKLDTVEAMERVIVKVADKLSRRGKLYD